MRAVDPGDRRLVISTSRAGTMLRLSVHDRGGGIPPRELAGILDPFYTTKPGGIGMGLPIARLAS